MSDPKGLKGRTLTQLSNAPIQEVRREQQIDGSNMPDYSQVQKYLGVLGVYLVAEDEGMYGAGVGLSRAQSNLAVANSVEAVEPVEAESSDSDER